MILSFGELQFVISQFSLLFYSENSDKCPTQFKITCFNIQLYKTEENSKSSHLRNWNRGMFGMKNDSVINKIAADFCRSTNR